MADNLEETNGQQPPRLNVDADQAAAGTPKPPLPKVRKPAPPPKVRVAADRPKNETARISLDEAQLNVPRGIAPRVVKGPEDVKKSTTRIETSTMKPLSEEEKEEGAKRATVRIDLAAVGLQPQTPQDKAEAGKKSTVKIETSTPSSGLKAITADDLAETGKKSTIKIDEAASEFQPVAGEQIEEAAKKSTIRIDTIATAPGMAPMNEHDREEAVKKTTVRVQIDEDRAKGDTARLDVAAMTAKQETLKKRTAKIDLNEVMSEDDDIFKRRTALIDASKFAGTTDSPGAPRTIRIKRPDAPPTSLMPRPGEQATLTPTTEGDEVQAKKSETARIDLPPEVEAEQPPTRRKTIRIKRPGAGGVSSKQLVISRAAAAEAPVELPAGRTSGEETAHPAFSWVAIAAILVAVVLVYVLGSQVGTVAGLSPVRWPFPGSL